MLNWRRKEKSLALLAMEFEESGDVKTCEEDRVHTNRTWHRGGELEAQREVGVEELQ